MFFDLFERHPVSILVYSAYYVFGLIPHPFESVVDYKPFVAIVAEEFLLRTGSIVPHPFLRDIVRAAIVT